MALFDNLGKKKTGVLPYVLLLILATIVLFFITYTSFTQNRALRKSTEQVVHTQEVITEINMLFGNYTGAETVGIKYLVSNDSTYLSPVQGFKYKSMFSSKRLAKLLVDSDQQLERLNRLPKLSDQLYGELRSLNPETAENTFRSQTFRDRVSKIEGYLESLESIQTEMIAAEYALLKKRRQDYESEVTLTPVNILYSSLFALGILMFAFSKINSDRKKMGATRSFLRNILSTVQSTVSFFEAVRSDQGNIVDFKIVYTNEKIEDLIGKSAEDIEGNLISKEYPFLMKNGDFEIYCEVITSGKSQEYEREYDLPAGHFVFCNDTAKLDDGVTVVSQDITLRKLAEKELEDANERLALQNTVLNDAESAAGVGSCSLNITTDVITYSENCYRLLGVEPENSASSKNMISDRVLADDKERFERNTALTTDLKKGVRDVYRVKTENGNVKNLMMQSHFFEKNGERFMVGVIRDITQEVTNELTLRRRNRELERSNAELESFNRVASHDLQEPLRKIQMFISRLSDFERDNLSEKGTGYLEKIESSANRMQHLIRNLLAYSRVIDESGKQAKVDLNLVFEKVLDDLSEKIKQTKAHIGVPKLPVIYGTEFQLEQLFNNLLSNSLKYKKHDTPPIISVTSEILPYNKIDEELNLPHSRYLLLTLSDNGIGFDQGQSGKIFKLFERLHAKNAFSGTGLGLAICKKIVENHRGHIAAFGQHNEGTRMEVYLPYTEQRAE